MNNELTNSTLEAECGSTIANGVPVNIRVPSRKKPVRVLYSFPHKLGADRICYIAWQQVNGLAAAGAKVFACPGVLHVPVSPAVEVRPTLSLGKLRISYKLFGSLRACRLHDRIVARRLRKMAGQIDIVHTWPWGARETLKTARSLGIPTVLERPNAHTRFAYEVVQKECDRLGVVLPPKHEHAFKADVLAAEEAEYAEAFRLLCPSDFVVQTFIERGFSPEVLARHIYGYDEKVFYPRDPAEKKGDGLTMLFVGVCAVRKGVHFALEAWLASPAHRNGTFLIAGKFLPDYEKKLAPLLAHPSIKVLGHRTDIPDLARKSDILVLPSIEEGFGLVCAEAMGSGCVPLVSNACTDICKHEQSALIHRVGDVNALTEHITRLHNDRQLLRTLRSGALDASPGFTWGAAGERLLEVYRETITARASVS